MSPQKEGMDPATDGTHAEEPSVLRLTRAQFFGIIGVGVIIFLFSTGPLWRHPWRLDTLNQAVFYSYLPLPLLVVVGLWYKKRLGLRAFFLDTLAITLIKYSVTFGIALVLWSIAPAPPEEQSERATRYLEAKAPAVNEPLPAPTPIAPSLTGTVTGAVVDRNGARVSGALVFISGGLEGLVFAAPETTVELENDGTGIRPRLAAAQLHQPILARSVDGHLHTLLAMKNEEAQFNVPLLRSGAKASVRFREAHGVMRLGCRVHQRKEDGSPAEEEAFLGVFGHPFFAITGADGRFSWNGVPAGALSVTVWDRRHGESRREVPLLPLESVDVTMALR
jgi:hypothetical protein